MAQWGMGSAQSMGPREKGLFHRGLERVEGKLTHHPTPPRMGTDGERPFPCRRWRLPERDGLHFGETQPWGLGAYLPRRSAGLTGSSPRSMSGMGSQASPLCSLTRESEHEFRVPALQVG